MPYELSIEHMVCGRCISVVQQELQRLALPALSVQLGKVILTTTPAQPALQLLQARLGAQGFGFASTSGAARVAQIKALIIRLVQEQDGKLRYRLSDVLARALQQDYTKLSMLFTSEEKLSIERYFILQRVERVKELLQVTSLSITRLAEKTGFSSSAHLTAQFKKVTGSTPTAYRTRKLPARQTLDKVGQ